MLRNKLIALGMTAVFTLSSTAIPVFASAPKNNVPSKGNVKGITVNYYKPDNKGNDKKEKKQPNKFKDSGEVSWALNAIEKLAAKGILSGRTSTTFAPKANLTNLEALAMVMKLTGDSQTAEANNKRHPLYTGSTLNWGLGYIFVAIEKKIILPEELKGFNPLAPAKRHEVAKYIIRALGKTDEALEYMDEDLDFKDSAAVPKTSVGYVYLANELGFITGNDNNEFQPMRNITRAEMAVILDRIDGEVTLPDTDTRKSNVTFVSADYDDDEITVKVAGKTVTYKVDPDAPVYVDKEYEDLDALEAGDILKLTFNSSKQVIFIEVTGYKDTGDSTVEEEISASGVDYDDLSDILQEQVDYLKLTKNYKAYEYDGYIYLIATRGKKNTGGYDIDITDTYKVKLTSSTYNVKAIVETDDPSSGEIVTQAITYPYSIVRFKSFDGLKNIVFTDEDNNKLAEVKPVELDEVETVKGTIQSLSTSSKTIKVLTSEGKTYQFVIPASADIEVNGDDAEYSDLVKNMNVTVELSDDIVVKVDADTKLTEVKGMLSGINIGSTKTITVKVGSSFKTYTVSSDVEITIGGDSAELADLDINDDITLEFSNDVLVEIAQ